MDVFKNLDDIMVHYEIVPLIVGQVKEKFVAAIKVMRAHIERDAPLDDIGVNDIEQIMAVSQLLVSLLIERDIRKTIEVNFVNNMCYLMYNWNENYHDNASIKKNCLFIQNYMDNSLSFSELIQTLKTFTARLESYTKSDLPTFKLSDHYFNIIKKESENEFHMAPSNKGR